MNMKLTFAMLVLVSAAAVAQDNAHIVTIIPKADDSVVGELRMREKYANGQNYWGLKAPDSLAANIVFTGPGVDGSSGKCWGWTSALTLGWVTCSGLPVVDTTAIVKGSDDASKQVRIEVDGLTPGTTRVMTMPDSNIALMSTDTSQTITGAKLFNAYLTMENSKGIYLRDTGGTAHLFAHMDSANDVNVGTQDVTSLPSGNGALSLYARGQKLITLMAPPATGRNTFYPLVNGQTQLGATTGCGTGGTGPCHWGPAFLGPLSVYTDTPADPAFIDLYSGTYGENKAVRHYGPASFGSNSGYNLYWPNKQADAAGQVLANNGSGTLSWATISGTISGLTAGRIPIAASASSLYDSSYLYWDSGTRLNSLLFRSLALPGDAHEGGQFELEGAGDYPDWFIDVYDSSLRIFNGSYSATSVQMFNTRGPFSLWVGGAVSADGAITGNSLTTNLFTMPTNAAAGKVLTSNASGGGTWQPAPIPSGMMTTNTDQNVTGVKTVQTAFGVDYLRIHKVSDRTTTWQHELTSDGTAYRLKDPGPNIVLQIQTTPARVVTLMGSLIPSGGATYSLGASGYAWTKLWTADVSATGNVSVGSFTMSTNAAAGKVLTSDASGGGTWQPAPIPSGMMTTNTDQNVTGVKTVQTAFGVDYLRIHKVSDRTTNWQHELTSDGTAYRLKDPGPNIVLQIQTTPARIATWMATLIPNGGNTYDLGATGYYWKQSFVNTVTVGQYLNGTFSMSGNMTISGNMYNRTFSGTPSCSGVADGWTGVDTSNKRSYVCIGGSAYYSQLTT